MLNGAVFLDRDGTIIEDVNYLSDLRDIRIYDFAFDAIKIFNSLSLKVIVITNQSGIGRGYFSSEFVETTHGYLKDKLQKRGAVIDDFFYCPHLPEDNCKCRKPETGMIKDAVDKYNIDLSKSFFIGDSPKDVEAGFNVKVFPIQVLTGYGKEKRNENAVYTLNLYSAALFVKNILI